MHRLIVDRYVSMGDNEIDHIDRNGLNNVKSNLRFCSRGENNHNTRNWGAHPKGVGLVNIRYKNKSGEIITYSKYRARINYKGKSIFLGNFKTIKDAEDAYNKASLRYYGI